MFLDLYSGFLSFWDTTIPIHVSEKGQFGLSDTCVHYVVTLITGVEGVKHARDPLVGGM